MLRLSLQSFVERYAIQPNGCWEWQRHLTRDGYGTFGSELAHRVSWKIHHTAPGSLYVLHSCDNPPCVNPEHLFLGTQTDNMRDMLAKGRGTHLRGENCGASRLTWAEVCGIRELRTQGYSYRELAMIFKTDFTNVADIVRLRTWRHAA